MELEKRTLTTVKGRLQTFIDSRGITDREFCRRIGVSPAYVTSMRKSVSPNVMDKIKDAYPMLNPLWLLAGSGKMLLYSDETINQPSSAAVGDGLLPSEKLDLILEEMRNERKRLIATNEALAKTVERQNETIAELNREIKKINARTEGDATCAAVG